jgi:hypothetical protein
MGNGAANGLLEKAELFHGLPRDALAAVVDGATRLPSSKSAQLLKQGDPPDHPFMVERGSAAPRFSAGLHIPQLRRRPKNTTVP